MAFNLGDSFAPTQDQAEDAGRRAALEGVPQAIKMLSLRLPQILGARAPMAAPLMQSQGMAGLGQGAQALFQSLINQLGASTNPMGAPAPGGWPGSGPGIPNPPPVGARNPTGPMSPPVGDTGAGFPPPPKGPQDSGGPVMPSYTPRFEVSDGPAPMVRRPVRGGYGA